MKYLQEICPILSKRQLTKLSFDITVSAPQMAALAKTGQFAQITCDGFFLRRPISICDFDKEKGRCALSSKYAEKEPSGCQR